MSEGQKTDDAGLTTGSGKGFLSSVFRRLSAEDAAPSNIVSDSSSTLLRALTGSLSDVGEFYFPGDLIGGICPRIVGSEEDIVWNAAAEACDSERVHVVWQSAGNRIWYLATRSADLASQANSWCPLAALLPTEKDLEDLPICYTYFGEETAVLMVVAAEELHVFRGTAAVVRAKAERTTRELGEKAKIVNIDLFRIGQMTPVPWYSASLFEDRARRVLAAVSVLVSLAIVGFSFLVWLMASMAMISARHDLDAAVANTRAKSMQLVNIAENLRASPIRAQIEKFLDVNDGLLSLNGFLNVYEIEKNKTRWRATVPPSATADRITALGGKNIETTDQGVIIGNDAEIEYEASKVRK
ncbi:MAG: hypothetical protein P4M13_06620 [Alphaproteobacteria bacterium]|nr:hypothetical protein [Alphaproteobacteria bacterium]